MVKARQPSTEAIAAAAAALGCEVAAIRAVAEVEAGPHGAFLDAPGEPPVILFERHLFDRLTEGRYRGARAAGLPDGCSVIAWPEAGGYGTVAQQHRRLAAAVALDEAAALASASWGLYQILGVHHRRCGFPDLRAWVRAMERSVDDHLRAFIAFVYSDARLNLALRRLDWPDFARIYNGPSYAANRYDVRLAEAYRRATA